MKLTDLNDWIPLRSASTTEWHATYATLGSFIVHRWQRDGHETVYNVSNGAWGPGDHDVVTLESPFAETPRHFIPRAQWCSRPAREDAKLASGWAPRMVPTDPGEQGGGGIEIHPRANPTTARADSWADRTPTAAYHRGTGLPLKRRDVGNWFEYRMDRLPSHSEPEIQRLPMFDRNEPLWPTHFWEAPDEYHLCRAYMEDLGLWRLQRDPVARWRILSLAEDMRLSYTLEGKQQDVGSSWVPFSLRTMLQKAEASPGKGGKIVRGVAWSMRLGVAALEVGPPNPEEWRTWLAAMIRYCGLVQLPCGGFYSATYGYGMDQDEPWLLYDLDETKQECPVWQVSFLVRALWEAQKQLPGKKRQVVGILTNAKKIWDTAPYVADEYGGAPGPNRYCVTAVNGALVPTITEGVAPARTENQADTMACFAEAGIA